MSLLNVLNDAPGFAKMSLQGPQGSGKSWTAMQIAITLHRLFKSTKPVAFFDTESGSDYLTKVAKEGTGHDLVRVKTRAFSSLMETVRECEAGAADILIVDSMTHVWRELQEAYMTRINEDRRFKKTRMDIGDIMEIKKQWYPWPDLYLNARVHILVCGREGNEWGFEEDEETGKRELVATGKKMKVEGEFGYESSLMLAMSIEQNAEVTKRKKVRGKIERTKEARHVIHVATVLKDRWDELDGMRFENPSGKEFMPFFSKLNPPSHAPVNTLESSASSLPEYDGGYARAKTDREITVEKIQAQLLRAYPGQTATEKKARNDAFDEFFQTRSWTEIEKRVSLPQLIAGLQRLKEFVDNLEAVRNEPPKADEDVPTITANADTQANFNRITDLSTQLLDRKVPKDWIENWCKEVAKVDAVQFIKAEHYPLIIARLELELNALPKTRTRKPKALVPAAATHDAAVASGQG